VLLALGLVSIYAEARDEYVVASESRLVVAKIVEVGDNDDTNFV